MEGRVGNDVLEVAIQRSSAGDTGRGSGGRKRIRVNGVGRRAGALGRHLRVVLFAPEEMLLVVGSPSLRRAAIDALGAALFPTYADSLSTYGRTLQQRNSLLRAIREEAASRDQLRFWDESFIETGGQVVAARHRLLEALAAPLAAAHREIAPEESTSGSLEMRYVTNAPTQLLETPRDALARRLVETADKEIWNGSTVIGPHRDDIAFDLAGRDLAGFASRGQQRTAILASKLAELDVLTEHDGHPPLLLLDDVFSELDPERRAHLVRRIAELPQAFVTTTTPDDLDPGLVAIAHGWEVKAGEDGAQLRPAGTPAHAMGDA